MKPIQFMLLAALGLFLILYLRWLRSKLLDRVILLALAAASAYFVLDPDSCTALARLIGVGRGADLIFYSGLSFFGFMALLLYSKQRTLEARVTRLVRAIALMTAQRPAEPTGTNAASPPSIPLPAVAPRSRAG